MWVLFALTVKKFPSLENFFPQTLVAAFVTNIRYVSGSSEVGAIKYPMALLGNKSRPQLKHLKPFIKVISMMISLLEPFMTISEYNARSRRYWIKTIKSL